MDLFDYLPAPSDAELNSSGHKHFLRNSVRKNAQMHQDLDSVRQDSAKIPIQKLSKEEVKVSTLTEANVQAFNKMQKDNMVVYF